MNTQIEKFWIPRKADTRTILSASRTPPELMNPKYRLMLRPDKDGIHVPVIEERITCTREQYETYMRAFQ